jgi:hypothetical protein
MVNVKGNTKEIISDSCSVCKLAVPLCLHLQQMVRFGTRRFINVITKCCH